MTLDKARELIKMQISLGGGYNRNVTRVILSEVNKIHGQEGVNRLIRELNLQEASD